MRFANANESPIVPTIVIAGGALVLLTGTGAALGLDPYLVGNMAAKVVLAGVVLGAWAGQAQTPWSRVGYLWRYGVALVVVIMLGALCSGPVDRSAT